MAEVQTVLSIFPDKSRSTQIRKLLAPHSEAWRHLEVTGAAAAQLLTEARSLKSSLATASRMVRGGNDLPGRKALSEKLASAIGSQELGTRVLVVAPTVVPIDMTLTQQGRALGESAIISHLPTGDAPPSAFMLQQALNPHVLPLRGYRLVCPMAVDRPRPRHLQDIVTVALGLEHRLPVELWLQPSLRRALASLSGRDVSWLHWDTHGNPDGSAIMLGATRDGGAWVTAEDLPARVSVPLVMACGCALTAGHESIGGQLIERGALSVFGPCVIFESLGVANSEEGEALWYRNFFEALLEGQDVGTSLLHARRHTPGGLLKFAWVLLGSSRLRFRSATAQA